MNLRSPSLSWYPGALQSQKDFIALNPSEKVLIEQIMDRFPKLGIGLSTKRDPNIFERSYVQFMAWIERHRISKIFISFCFSLYESYPITSSELEALWRLIAHFGKLRELSFSYNPNIKMGTKPDDELKIHSQIPPVHINLDLFSITPLIKLHFFGPFKLEGEISSIQNLEILIIAMNPYGSFYEGLPLLSHLHTLKYSYVMIDDMSTVRFPFILTSMHQLKELVFEYIGLQDFPDNSDYFPNLEHLSLSGNHLTTIPPSIFHLPKLQDVSFFANHIVRVPAEYREAKCVVHPLPVRSLANLVPYQQIEALRSHNSSLPPSVRALWERWKDSAEFQRLTESHSGLGNPRNDDVLEIMHELMAQLNLLYMEQWEDLIERIIKIPDIQLTQWEIERIVWEATPSE